jgi:hypothetical protein
VEAVSHLELYRHDLLIIFLSNSTGRGPFLLVQCSPHVAVAQYAQEDPDTGNQLLVHCQSANAISAEQCVVESLHMVKGMFGAVKVIITTGAAVSLLA